MERLTLLADQAAAMSAVSLQKEVEAVLAAAAAAPDLQPDLAALAVSVPDNPGRAGAGQQGAGLQGAGLQGTGRPGVAVLVRGRLLDTVDRTNTCTPLRQHTNIGGRIKPIFTQSADECLPPLPASDVSGRQAALRTAVRRDGGVGERQQQCT